MQGLSVNNGLKKLGPAFDLLPYESLSGIIQSPPGWRNGRRGGLKHHLG